MTRSSLVLALVPFVLAAAAQAQTVVPPVSTVPGVTPHPAHGGSIIELRQKALAKIQEKMSRLQAEQSCVSTAQDANALRICREQASDGVHEKKC